MLCNDSKKKSTQIDSVFLYCWGRSLRYTYFKVMHCNTFITNKSIKMSVLKHVCSNPTSNIYTSNCVIWGILSAINIKKKYVCFYFKGQVWGC